jgi:leucyl-tRNA synthetase
VVPQTYSEPYYRRISHGVILGPDGLRMSKSRKNIINPDDKWKKYGVDVLRIYLMFMGPFESTMAWNENAFKGVSRFLVRFQSLVETQIAQKNESDNRAKQVINHLIAKVGEDFDNFSFNTAIAAMMEATNEINNHNLIVSEKDLASLVKLLSPLAPYLSEELWCQVLRKPFSVHQQPWPKIQKEYLKTEKNTIIVQVNGRLRGKIDIDSSLSIDKDTVISLIEKEETLKKHLSGQKIKKIVFVPGKIINFVI